MVDSNSLTCTDADCDANVLNSDKIPAMRIATWCIGGINAKLRYLLRWLDRRKPDVVALQKTFAATEKFPKKQLRDARYESFPHARDGEHMNGWGVAVLVREGLEPKDWRTGLCCPWDPGARFVTVAVGDLEFSSVYAVYGNPTVRGIPGALERKLKWMKQLQEHVDKRSNLSGACVLAGDFNVISDGPTDDKKLLRTTRERRAFDAVLDLGLVDLYRLRHPDPKTGFNCGGVNPKDPVTSRLHRILGTETVADQVCYACVDLEYRKAARSPSAPVIVDLRIDLTRDSRSTAH